MAGKRAGQAFFKHIRDSKTPSLFKSMLRSLDSGMYHMPKSFEVLARFDTEELKLQHAKPSRVQADDHRLMRQFYARYPEARLEPLQLQSFEWPVARQFAQRVRQLEREQHMPMAKAFEAVEAELQPQLRQLRRRASSAGSHIGLIQQEEEIQLRAALDAAATRAQSKAQ